MNKEYIFREYFLLFFKRRHILRFSSTKNHRPCILLTVGNRFFFREQFQFTGFLVGNKEKRCFYVTFHFYTPLRTLNYCQYKTVMLRRHLEVCCPRPRDNIRESLRRLFRPFDTIIVRQSTVIPITVQILIIYIYSYIYTEISLLAWYIIDESLLLVKLTLAISALSTRIILAPFPT